jgi:CobQ-like glutamine amidotransferase family enzyme
VPDFALHSGGRFPPRAITLQVRSWCFAAVAELELRVLWLYPEHMNIYADRGNITVLERRCEWRGIRFRLAPCGLDEALDPSAHDLLYIGGGQDRDQALVAGDLVETKREPIADALAAGTAMLAVCGGYQLLGRAYALPSGESLPGLALVGMETAREPGPRLIGNVVIEADLGDGARRIAGFENHGGRTYLDGDEEPLGRVISGAGNNGLDGFEGVRRGRLIGTYLHGPLLPKNAWLADRLIEWGLASRFDGAVPLEPLDDELEIQAHACAERAALRR